MMTEDDTPLTEAEWDAINEGHIEAQEEHDRQCDAAWRELYGVVDKLIALAGEENVSRGLSGIADIIKPKPAKRGRGKPVAFATIMMIHKYNDALAKGERGRAVIERYASQTGVDAESIVRKIRRHKAKR
jgi:hypothetical protein